MTSLCGTSFHLEHSIGGGQGLVVSREREVAEAGLQVDDQVGGAVEREGGVTRKKREPATDRSGTLLNRRWVSFVQSFDRQDGDQICTSLHEVVSVSSPHPTDPGRLSSLLPQQTYKALWYRKQGTGGHLL